MKNNHDGIDFWFEDQDPHLEDEFRESKFKKVFVISIAIFLLIITLSYFLLSIPTFSTFIGLVTSEKSADDVFDYGNKTIFFRGNTLQILNTYYENQVDHETSLCLLGSLIDSNYIISEIYEPKASFQSYTRVVHERCNSNTLITFHTHPYKECVASDTDINSLRNFQQVNPDAIGGIMCEPYRINFYS